MKQIYLYINVNQYYYYYYYSIEKKNKIVNSQCTHLLSCFFHHHYQHKRGVTLTMIYHQVKQIDSFSSSSILLLFKTLLSKRRVKSAGLKSNTSF